MQKMFLQPRRALALCLTAALFLTSLVWPSFAAELSGSGTAESPYQISSEAELAAFRDKVNGGETGAHAELTVDIELTAAWTPIGTQTQPYTGTFNGGGYTISNLFAPYAGSYPSVAALFGRSDGAIRDLTVITSSSGLSATDYAAAVCAVNHGTIERCASAGYVASFGGTASFAGGIAAVNYGSIKGCTNQSSVGVMSDDSCAGGIAAVGVSGSITDCVNTGGITAMDAGRDSTELCTGGIVGLNYAAAVERCTNSGTVTSDSSLGYSGGVAGLNNGVVSDSVNSASIYGQYLHGGVAGYVYTNSDTSMTAQVRNTLDVSGNVVYGKNEGGSTSNNYYKSSSSDNGAGSGQIAVTDAQLESGEVAYRLNGNSTANAVWGQDLSTESVPVVGSKDVVYAKYENGSVSGYTNDESESHEHQFDESGKCTVEGCGYESVKLDGYTLTLDGAIGVTFYYEIDPMYLTDGSDVSVTFTMDGKDTNVPLDESYSYRADGKTLFGFKTYVASDQMTHRIAPVLNITGSSAVTLSNDQTYCVYDYLEQVLQDESAYSAELVQLAKSMATYDYYANLYFNYYGDYTPKIEPLDIQQVTADDLVSYQQKTVSLSSTPITFKTFSLFFLDSVYTRYYVTADESVDPAQLYMGYRALNSGELYTYVPAVQSGARFYGETAKFPASKMGSMYEIAFFIKDESGNYTQVSDGKISSPYSYAYTALTYSAASEEIRNLSRALYLYGEAAKDYFASVL